MGETKRVYFTDTTLRDGGQTKGVNFDMEASLDIAHSLANTGVHAIEAGFPVAKPEQKAIVERIAREITGASVMALTRLKYDEIAQTWDALKDAENPVLHTWYGTSPMHLKKNRNTPEGLLKLMDVTLPKTMDLIGNDGILQFSPEDAFRTERNFLVEVVGRAIQHGAKWINIPDTVGYAVPEETADLFTYLHNQLPELNKVLVKFHPHNDMGNAVDNSVAALLTGYVKAIEGTINGLGERTGNVDLIQLGGRLHVRKDFYNIELGKWDIRMTGPLAKKVSAYSGKPIPHNSPFVGEGAFHHESGVHRSGVGRVRESYEITSQSDFGLDAIAAEHDSIGPMSGRSNVMDIATKLGYKDLTEDEVKKTYDICMSILDRRSHVTGEELGEIIGDVVRTPEGPYELLEARVTSELGGPKSAIVKLKSGEEVGRYNTSLGDGPVDAAKRAIDDALGVSYEMADFAIETVGGKGGSDSFGKVRMVVKNNGNQVTSTAIRSDVIEAAATAYINACNKMYAMENA